MKNLLYNFSKRLAQIPSMGYALLYLACIPIFALVYARMPYAFYHSTVQFEPTLNSDAAALLGPLREAIVKQAIPPTHLSDKPVADITTLELHSIKFINEQFEVRGSIMSLEGNPSYETISFRFPDRAMMGTMNPATRDWTHSRQITLPAFGFIDCSALFPDFAGNTSPTIQSLKCGTDLNNSLLAFANAKKGFPSAVSASYSRMLYFSVVTITTLGYGDIVPITSSARFAIGLEAILGIILVGLFLNALSHEATKGKTAT